jgi:hypothetical protein
MAHFIQLRRFRDNEIVVINVDDIVKVAPSVRQTSDVHLRDASCSMQVLESVEEVYKKLAPQIEKAEQSEI